MRVIGFAGWSGSGKTTLLVRLVPLLVARGRRVSTLKRAHHSFDVDTPGKDSYEHRQAGATEVLVVSENRFALIHELRDEPEPGLAALLPKLAPVDLVLVEGFKHGRQRRIEVNRTEVGKDWLWQNDAAIVALASDARPDGLTIPFAAIDDIEAVADLVEALAEPVETLLQRLRET